MVVIACLLLAAGLVWLEVRRVNRHWLLWRVIATLTACIMLAGIIIPLSYRQQADTADEHKAILLTAGFDADSLNDKTQEVFTFDETVKTAYPKAGLITPEELNKTDQLHIYGYGLTGYELQQLNGQPVIFHPAKMSSGVKNISYNGKLKAGEALRVQGCYYNPGSQKTKLVLKGLNTTLDSVIIKPGSPVNFELNTVPKTNGRVVYSLYADDNLQGSLPVQVDAIKPLKVLMLSASPDFEGRFLKNWLSENGYAVAIRSAISKEKYTTEFINIPQFPLNRLSASTFNKFDVVIGDLSALNALSVAEGAALKQEVTDNGLGVIIKADSTGTSSWLQRSFPANRPSEKENAPAALLIKGIDSITARISSPAYITYQNGTQSLVSNTQNHILVNSAISGSGKLVFTTLNNTFSWMLAGNKADYASLWSILISKAARKSADVINPVSAPSIPFIHEPVPLKITNSKQLPADINSRKVALSQNPDVPFEWAGLYWPLNKGWQIARQNSGVSWWYTYPKTDWKSIQASTKIALTTEFEKRYAKHAIVTKQIHEFVQIDVPKIYFYIVLLAACIFLWIETKVS